MRNARVAAAVVLAALILAGCAAGPTGLTDTADTKGVIAGFWRGLWHGFIAPFAFIVSLFSSDVQIYEVHNNGGWYNFGYILGLMAIFGGGGGGAARRRGRARRGD
jgi:hypothetical protein